MTKLAEKIEALEGPSREIFIAAYGEVYGLNPCLEDGLRTAERARRFLRLLDAEAWFDAAMTLAPEGWEWTIESGGHVEMTASRLREPHVEGNAETPELAFCAAALRAWEANR